MSRRGSKTRVFSLHASEMADVAACEELLVRLFFLPNGHNGIVINQSAVEPFGALGKS